jgi:hypothetical protein
VNIFLVKIEEVITISGFNDIIFSRLALFIPPIDGTDLISNGYLQKSVLPTKRLLQPKSQSSSVI